MSDTTECRPSEEMQQQLEDLAQVVECDVESLDVVTYQEPIDTKLPPMKTLSWSKETCC
jgi:hypothetical protein